VQHCTNAGCMEACPTGAIIRNEFDDVFVQPEICNGCGYCVPSCPFGVVDLIAPATTMRAVVSDAAPTTMRRSIMAASRANVRSVTIGRNSHDALARKPVRPSRFNSQRRRIARRAKKRVEQLQARA